LQTSLNILKCAYNYWKLYIGATAYSYLLRLSRFFEKWFFRVFV